MPTVCVPESTYCGRVCPACGGPKRRKKNKLCLGCYHKIRSSSVAMLCGWCGASFDRSRAEASKARRKGLVSAYCSLACRGAAMSLRRVGPPACERCGKETGKKQRRFCPGCRPKPQAFRLPPRGCSRCRAVFQPKSSRSQHCGRECANAAHAERMRGAGNSRFKNGRSYAKWFDLMRPLILERDGGRCVACGTAERKIPRRWRGREVMRSNLVIHHIDENPSNNVHTNLVTLCMTCHAIYHKKASVPSPFLWLGSYTLTACLFTTSKWKEAVTSLRTTYSCTTAASSTTR